MVPLPADSDSTAARCSTLTSSATSGATSDSDGDRTMRIDNVNAPNGGENKGDGGSAAANAKEAATLPSSTSSSAATVATAPRRLSGLTAATSASTAATSPTAGLSAAAVEEGSDESFFPRGGGCSSSSRRNLRGGTLASSGTSVRSSLTASLSSRMGDLTSSLLCAAAAGVGVSGDLSFAEGGELTDDDNDADAVTPIEEATAAAAADSAAVCPSGSTPAAVGGARSSLPLARPQPLGSAGRGRSCPLPEHGPSAAGVKAGGGSRRQLIHRGRSTRVFRVAELAQLEDGDDVAMHDDGSAAQQPAGGQQQRRRQNRRRSKEAIGKSVLRGATIAAATSSTHSSSSASASTAHKSFAVKTLGEGASCDDISRLYNEYHVLTRKLSKVPSVRRAVQKGLDGIAVAGLHDDDDDGDERGLSDSTGSSKTNSSVAAHSTVLEWVDGCTLREWMRSRPVFERYENENEPNENDDDEKEKEPYSSVFASNCPRAQSPLSQPPPRSARRLSNLTDGERANMLRTVRTLRDVARALACVHDAGVQHNDVTADNVIVVRSSAAEDDQDEGEDQCYGEDQRRRKAGDAGDSGAAASAAASTDEDHLAASSSSSVKIIGLGYASVIDALECDDDGGRVNDDLYALGVLIQDALSAELLQDRREAGDEGDDTSNAEDDDEEDDAPMGIPGLEPEPSHPTATAAADPRSTYRRLSSGFVGMTQLGFGGSGREFADGSANRQLRRLHPRAPRPLAKVASDLMEIGSNVQRYGCAREVADDLDEMLSEPGRFLFVPPGGRGIDFDSDSPLRGREKQTEALTVAYDRVARARSHGEGSSEVVLLSGPSGAGKSRLVDRTLRPLCRNFVSGKFDQSCVRTRPYSAVLDAFSELCDALVKREDDLSLRAIRARALEDIGVRGAEVLADVLPGLRQVLGEELFPRRTPSTAFSVSSFSIGGTSGGLDSTGKSEGISNSDRLSYSERGRSHPSSTGSTTTSNRDAALLSSHSRVSGTDGESVCTAKKRDTGSGLEVNFDEAVRGFLRAVSSTSSDAHPLVLFLDDLQWADAPSLRLINSILTDSDENRCRLLFVGSYRSDEVNDDDDKHPLRNCFQGASSRGVSVTTLEIPPLDRDAVCSLISSALRMTTRLVRPLADAVHRRTQGNALFVRHFLEALAADGILRFETTTLLWAWDDARVASREVHNDGVVRLLADKILRLPPSLREVLQILAFLGSSFEASTIELLVARSDTDHEDQDQLRRRSSSGNGGAALPPLEIEIPREMFAEMLLLAIEEGLVDEVAAVYSEPASPSAPSSSASIMPRSSSQNSFPGSSQQQRRSGAASVLDVLSPGRTYRFAHDRVRQASYDLVPSDGPARPALHLRIGELIWRNATDSQLFHDGGPKLFVLVDQLNRGRVVMAGDADPDRRDRLAALNLRAGERALSCGATGAAGHYLRAGVELLGAEDNAIEGDGDGNEGEGGCWCRRYELALALTSACAEAEYRAGRYDAMEVLLQRVFGNAMCVHDQVGSYCTLLKSLGARDRMQEAIDSGFDLLEQLGEPFPRKGASDFTVAMDLARTKLLLRGKTDEDILSLPTLEEQHIIDAMKVMSAIILYVYLTNIDYLPLVGLRMLRLSVKHGVCEATAFAFGIYGTIHTGALGDLNGGHRYGRIALGLLERFKATDWLARVHCAHFSCIDHWRQGIKSSIEPFANAYRIGLKAGDVEYSMLNLHFTCCHAFHSGEPLGPLEEKSRGYARIIAEYKQDQALSIHLPMWQAMLNLTGHLSNRTDLTGEAMDEEAALRVAEERGNATEASVIYFFKMILAYLFGNYELAARMGKKSRNLREVALGTFVTARHPLYEALTAFALARAAKRRRVGRRTRSSAKKLKKWAAHSPSNHSQGYLLLKAEGAALRGKRMDALRLYDASIEAAAKNGFLQDEALANERAGLFLRESEEMVSASRYLARAYVCYKNWGAHAKADDLRQTLSFTLPPTIPQ